MFPFLKSNSVLGIDVGTSYIKAVQLKSGQGMPVLESYGIVNVIYPSQVVDKIDVVKQTAEILKTLCARSHFSTRRAVVSLPSNVAFVSVLTVPRMSEEELQKAVEYQAKKYIPLSLNDVNLGWQTLEETKKGVDEKAENYRVKVLLTAVPKNVINNYSKVMEMAGLEPLAIEPESISLIRSLVPASDLHGILIVDVGAKTASISMVDQGYLWATRQLTVGGDTITASIAKSMGLSFERADQIKRMEMSTVGAVSPAMQMTKSIVEMIKSETQQLIRIAENQGKKITKIILTGGGSKLPNLEQEFSSLGPVVEKGNPLQHISLPPGSESKIQQLAPQLAVSLGLALRMIKN